MTQLHLKLHQPQAQGYLEAAAVATVRLLADASGKVAKRWWTREKPVAIAGGDGELGTHTVFDLPTGGHYGVEITRPRGSEIAREFLVKEGEVRRETITMEGSPHEYLGWQQFAGIVRSDPYRTEIDRGPAAPHPSGTGWLDTLMGKGHDRIEALYRGVRGVPSVFAADLPDSERAWTLVKEASTGGSVAWARAGAALDWAAQSDAELATWFRTMPSPDEGLALIERLRSKSPAADPIHSRFPRWLSFETDRQIDLASIPWPWWGMQRHAEEEIRFLFDLVRPSSIDRDSPGHLVVSVQDRRWFALLEFLASDRLNRAGDIVDEVLLGESPESALYGKSKGPLVAVAGGIVLIARAKSHDRQYWDQWLENLSNWFPGIPDGPILLGCRQMQQARNTDELVRAYRHLREGMGRGIPFFSASIRMLAMALAQLGDDIPDADRDRREIASVSSRVDPDQPFTVIRL